MTVALLVVGVLLCLLVRAPVAVALLAPSLLYILLDPDLTPAIALQRVTAGLDSFPLLAVPLFIMAGFVANASGLADRLFRFLLQVLGPLPGSLGYVNISTSVVFSWMSGAAVADAAGLGTVMVPAMRDRKYDDRFAIGLTGASSAIGPVMPPSIPAIIYAVTAGVSVAALFFAGILPALVLAAVLALWVFLHARRRPELRVERPPGSEIRRGAVRALPVLFTPVIILGGILGGIFTPTEAAAVAVTYLVLLGVVVYRSLTPGGLARVVRDTAGTTGAIMLIVAVSSLFGYILARERAPEMAAEAIGAVTDNPLVFLLLVNIALLVIGMVLEPVSAILITLPVLLPIAGDFGVDPLHLGVLMVLNLTIGLLTPPVGLVLYVLGSVTNTPFPRVARGVLPFLAPLGIALLIVTFVPTVSLFLPRALGFVS